MLDVRLLALDLDGTLVDSAPDLAHCLGAALEAVGLPRPAETHTRAWIGDGIDTLLRRALHAAAGSAPDAPTLGRALQVFDECYHANLFSRSRLYPGVVATLDELAARGIVLGCVTNKRFAFAARLLDLAGLADHLRFVLGGDSLSGKKPSPVQLVAATKLTGIPGRRSALVGDSVHDEHAAAAAGFGFVWAAYGYGAPESTPLLRIDAFDELLAHVPGGGFDDRQT